MADQMSSEPHFKGESTEDTIEEVKSGSIYGGKFYKIKPQGLSIVWGNDKRYWRLPEPNDKRPAELLQVCWLEVTGSIKLEKLRPAKVCNISFKIGMKPDAFGWSGTPVYLMAKIGKKGKFFWKSANLINNRKPYEIPDGESLQIQLPPKPVPELPDDEKLYFGLYEVWRGRWKGGLQIYEVIITPQESMIQVL